MLPLLSVQVLKLSEPMQEAKAEEVAARLMARPARNFFMVALLARGGATEDMAGYGKVPETSV